MMFDRREILESAVAALFGTVLPTPPAHPPGHRNWFVVISGSTFVGSREQGGSSFSLDFLIEQQPHASVDAWSQAVLARPPIEIDVTAGGRVIGKAVVVFESVTVEPR